MGNGIWGKGKGKRGKIKFIPFPLPPQYGSVLPRRSPQPPLKRLAQNLLLPDFSRHVENPSPNLSPARREALISPPSLVGYSWRIRGDTPH
ncbi:tetratricopeptide TPR_4 [Nostoc linckia NIES-25]|nr:tetratricopeptide TPR_4 [Nostoc linckia NIES-25]